MQDSLVSGIAESDDPNCGTGYNVNCLLALRLRSSISGSDQETFSDYVIEELMITLVNGEKLAALDRQEIDQIRMEMSFQFSGDMSDKSDQRDAWRPDHVIYQGVCVF